MKKISFYHWIVSQKNEMAQAYALLKFLDKYTIQPFAMSTFQSLRDHLDQMGSPTCYYALLNELYRGFKIRT